jgi:molybdate transport system ATP-binding protein
VTLHADVHLELGSLRLHVVLDVGPREVVAVLGPNGAGKTTLLRALAGLEPLSGGRVELSGDVLEEPATGIRLPPERRPIGLVFQDYVLFPNLTAIENVAFGLRCRGVRRSEARSEAARWLERLGASDLAGRKPSRLSGGQAQRVALARALAIRPRMLLLDEPMSSLDVTARAEIRRRLREHLATFEGIKLLVTHDPAEALGLADRIVVLENGAVTQSGSPSEVAARPRSPYAADLAGVNLLRGHASEGVLSLEAGGTVNLADRVEGDVFAVVHPRAVAVYVHAPEGSPRNVWPGRVADVDLEGERVRLRVEAAVPLVAEITGAAHRSLGLAHGAEVWTAVKATEITTYPA